MEEFVTKYNMTKEERDIMVKWCLDNGIKMQFFASKALKEAIDKIKEVK